ncbi:MAG: LysM peptidoglycan-binding domain-containing protein [Bacteroidales bacterium]|nr:LysM peptidoglycan-binding domain-containing protein [Bacteroidales bacterium]
MKRSVVLLLLMGWSVFIKADSVPPDSLNISVLPDSISQELNISDSLLVVNDTINVDALDSLAFETFYGDKVFIPDTAVLNINNYASDFVPVFNDSVYEARFEEINRNTPFEFVYNKTVRNQIDLYSIHRRALTSKMLGLAEHYFPLFEEYLDKYDMPLELKYLAIVESALNPTAGSHAGAKGLWQFMYGTGRMYGLKSTSMVDDRFDPIKSTDAACRHLLDLYKIYDNWSLALAAYNSGTGNVNKAIRRAGNLKSYWAVWPFLPRETRGYVPAFFAVTYVMTYASEHNIYPKRPDYLYHQIDTVTVKDVISFDQISELMGISKQDLKMLNPSFKQGIIPATADNPYILRLPYDYIGDFVVLEDSLYSFKTKKGIERDQLLAQIKKASERSIHKVKSGETLGHIARKYRTSVKNLKKWNNLRSNTIRIGQKLVVYSPYSDNYLKSTAKVKKSGGGVHLVQKGETLGMISKTYNISVSDIKKWNGMNKSTIYPKQKLYVKNPVSI